ncbi:MAG: hypothetical protein EOM64_09310 [Erysipelotrichia bacterium]|nr:hypothetical protein [Erysipelotrichia bacterium]
MQYKELIQRYPVFYFHDFQIEESKEELSIHYDFEIEGLSHFNPEFVLPKPHDSTCYISELAVLREAAFSLGLVELISYWKITCSPEVVIECGFLNAEQIIWWKKLYCNGLGEFFYKNKIDVDPQQFMHVTVLGNRIRGREDSRIYSGNLIPVGGGKDSFVSLDLLKGMKNENHAFVIGRVMSAIHSAMAAGYSGEQLINAERTLDPRMLEFNKEHYLNGHTPFSAMAAFASVLTAIVYGKRYICLSNEASANESTIKDSKVNHQYSKTYEFEVDFMEYIDTYLTREIHYFSLLRPLSELQIAGLFSALPQYHPIFRSCNVGQKTETWCGHCAKCMFVGIMMSAFLEDEQIIDIFQRNMLNDPEMRTLFEQLSGMLDDKPFECVGTRDEVNIAICMSIEHHEQNQKELPLLYAEYKASKYYDFYRNKSRGLDHWNHENLVPQEYQKLIHERLSEIFK